MKPWMSKLAMLCLALMMALPASAADEKKKAPAKKPVAKSPAKSNPSGNAAQTVQDTLSVTDLEVNIIMQDGSELDGFVQDARFFEEYNPAKRIYERTSRALTVDVFDSMGRPRPTAIQGGMLPKEVDQASFTGLAIPTGNVQDIVIRVYFPGNLSGSIAVPYDRIEYIEIHGFVTENRIREVKEAVEKNVASAKERGSLAAERLKKYFLQKHADAAKAAAGGTLQEQMEKISSSKAERAELLKRFPPEEGWSAEKYDQIGKDYISTTGYVDEEEDYFYKHFEEWKLAVSDQKAAGGNPSEALMMMYPPKDGWSAAKKDELQAKLEAGEALTDNEAVFVSEFAAWSKAYQEMVTQAFELTTPYPEADWGQAKRMELKAKQDAGEDLSDAEQKFLDNFDSISGARQWLKDNMPKQ